VRVLLRSVLLAAGFALAACSATPGPSAAACRPELAASLPLRIESDALLIDATINDRPAVMMVDTGSERMLVTEEAQARFQLPNDPHRTTTVLGVGGSVRRSNVLIRRLGIGGLDTEDVSSAVAGLGARHFSGFVAGVIGADYLSLYDLEFDVPDSRLNLYRMPGCGERFRPPGAVADGTKLLRSTTNVMRTEMQVQNQRVMALLDTGAGRTTMTVQAAHRLGVTDGVLAAAPEGRSAGADGTPVAFHRHLFTDVDVGGQHLPEAWFAVSDVRITADVLLGVDWLRTRRVWVSYAAQRMFLLGPAGAGGKTASAL